MPDIDGGPCCAINTKLYHWATHFIPLSALGEPTP
jgi:hypothetical protein